MKKRFLTLFLMGVALSSPAISQSPSPASLPAVKATRQETEWVQDSLQRIQTVKVGMTRAQLLSLFTWNGGGATRTDQTFLYRGCYFFQVRVQFQPVGEDTGPFGNLNDKIVSISKPYLSQPLSA